MSREIVFWPAFCAYSLIQISNLLFFFKVNLICHIFALMYVCSSCEILLIHMFCGVLIVVFLIRTQIVHSYTYFVIHYILKYIFNKKNEFGNSGLETKCYYQLCFQFSAIISNIFSINLGCVIVFGSILNSANKKYSSEKLN